MWMLALLWACGDESRERDKASSDVDLSVCDDVGSTVVGVLNQITFARADESGVSVGFDLDGDVSSPGGSGGCGIGDYVSPEGDEGIDNAFSPIMTLLETTEAQNVEPLIQDTVNSGQLLLFFELEDVDDPVNDGCVGFEMLRGTGDPVVGNERIVSGQTFERDAETFSSVVEGVQIVDGTVIAGPITFDLPISIFSVDLVFTLADAYVRLDLREDGSYWGYISGGIDVDQIMAIATEENVNDEIAQLLEGVLGITADLAPDADGVCQQISVNLEFTGVSAFFFAEA